MCPLRGVARFAAESEKRLVAGSKISAVARSAEPLLPPATNTLPSSRVVAEALTRGLERLGAVVIELLAGSNK